MSPRGHASPDIQNLFQIQGFLDPIGGKCPLRATIYLAESPLGICPQESKLASHVHPLLLQHCSLQPRCGVSLDSHQQTNGNKERDIYKCCIHL